MLEDYHKDFREFIMGPNPKTSVFATDGIWLTFSVVLNFLYG